MSKAFLHRILMSTSALLSSAAGAEIFIDKNLKGGEQVYKEACIACHESGVAHAPKFQDEKAWAPLIAEGQAVLTGHAWVGVRAMPPRGGNPDLTLVEFARAAAYMSREAGSDWQDPDVAMMRAIMMEAEKRLDIAIGEAQAMKRELHGLIASP